MSEYSSSVFIAARDFEDALDALKFLSSSRDLSWVEPRCLARSSTLDLALSECGWETSHDCDGNAYDLTFVREKLGDETEIFNAIAPYVKAGSYIEMVGEDGDRWRWVFDGTKCDWVAPSELVWT